MITASLEQSKQEGEAGVFVESGQQICEAKQATKSFERIKRHKKNNHNFRNDYKIAVKCKTGFFKWD